MLFSRRYQMQAHQRVNNGAGIELLVKSLSLGHEKVEAQVFA